MEALLNLFEYRIVDFIVFLAICLACTKSDLILYPVCAAIVVLLASLVPFGFYQLWLNFDGGIFITLFLTALLGVFGYLMFICCKMIIVELISHHKYNGFKLWRR